MKILLPNKEVVKQFTKLVRPFYEKLTTNLKDSSNLSKIRDIILPKLISGELRVPNAEKLAEEVL